MCLTHAQELPRTSFYGRNVDRKECHIFGSVYSEKICIAFLFFNFSFIQKSVTFHFLFSYIYNKQWKQHFIFLTISRQLFQNKKQSKNEGYFSDLK